MERTNKDYSKRVKEKLIEKYPEVFKDIKESTIKKVIDFFTRNIEAIVFRKEHISITNFLNIYPHASDLYQDRYAYMKGKPLSQLGAELDAIAERERVRRERQKED